MERRVAPIDIDLADADARDHSAGDNYDSRESPIGWSRSTNVNYASVLTKRELCSRGD